MSAIVEIEKLFEEMTDEASLRTLLIDAKKPEDNFIEYKLKTNSDTPTLDSSDKKNHSRSLASFSSAEGGIVVWGIKAKAQQGEGDYAKTLKPIQQVEAFAENLRKLLLTTLRPSNGLIRIVAITKENGSGYVKVLVPEGVTPPYQAVDAGRAYYQRADGRTLTMEDFQVRDAMTRRGRPNIAVDFRTMPRKGNNGNILLHAAVAMCNEGNTVAKFIGWYMKVLSGATIHDVRSNKNQSDKEGERIAISSDISSSQVLHPHGMSDGGMGQFVLLVDEGATEIKVELIWYAEDMDVKRETIVLPIDDINVRNSRRFRGENKI